MSVQGLVSHLHNSLQKGFALLGGCACIANQYVRAGLITRLHSNGKHKRHEHKEIKTCGGM